MLIRLDEVESVMISVCHQIFPQKNLIFKVQIVFQTKQSTTNAKENIEVILSKKDQIYKLCKRIDDLEYFIDIVDNQLTNLTQKVEKAEKDLGISGNRITTLLKNVLFRSKSTRNDELQGFVPIETFRTEDFFKSSDN